MPWKFNWTAKGRWMSRANSYAKYRVTLSHPRLGRLGKMLWNNRFFFFFWLCYILKDVLMKGKWLMSSHARPWLGLINGKPLSPTPSKEALIITCHLNNILMSAPYLLHFYGILNHAQVWNTSNNEHENAKRFWLTSATEEPEMLYGELRNFTNWGIL